MFNRKTFLIIVALLFCFHFVLGNEYEEILNAYKSKNYSLVLEEFNTAEETLSSLNNSEKKLIFEMVGMSYFHLENYQSAIPFLRFSTLENINEKSHNDAYINCYYLSRSFKYLYIRDSSIFYSKLGVEQAQLTQSKDKLSRALHNLAVVYEDNGEYSKALLSYQKSSDHIHDDTLSFMKTRGNIADVYFKIGLLDSAFKIETDVYNYFSQNETDKYWKWLNTYRLAYIEKDYKNELAYSFYTELLSISESDYHKCLSLIGLGESSLLNKNDSTIIFMQSAEKVVNRTNNHILSRELNFLKANLYLDLLPNQDSLYSSIKLLDSILTHNPSRRSESLLRVIESKYHIIENNSSESIAAIDKAIVLASSNKNKDRLAEALTQKFNVLNHFGHYKEALAVKEEEIKVQQELFNDRSEAVYQILRTQNEVDKKESTIANQQLEIDNNNLQILIMYISIALVISALVFIFWQYRTRSKYAKKLETMFLDSRHRYMNNLLLLKNWFNEGKTEKNDEIISFAQNRIDAISTVNRHLDRLSYNKDTIASRSFLEDISHNLLAHREFTSDIQDVPINMSVSGPLGMITNEIITNGLKYGEEPYAIRFHKNGGGYTLEIEDHGPGITDPEKKGTGSKVLRLLSRQLKGELTYQNKADHSSEGRGTLVSLQFKG